jgi:hypothetical protein
LRRKTHRTVSTLAWRSGCTSTCCPAHTQSSPHGWKNTKNGTSRLPARGRYSWMPPGVYSPPVSLPRSRHWSGSGQTPCSTSGYAQASVRLAHRLSYARWWRPPCGSAPGGCDGIRDRPLPRHLRLHRRHLRQPPLRHRRRPARLAAHRELVRLRTVRGRTAASLLRSAAYPAAAAIGPAPALTSSADPAPAARSGGCRRCVDRLRLHGIPRSRRADRTSRRVGRR